MSSYIYIQRDKRRIYSKIDIQYSLSSIVHQRNLFIHILHSTFYIYLIAILCFSQCVIKNVSPKRKGLKCVFVSFMSFSIFSSQTKISESNYISINRSAFSVRFLMFFPFNFQLKNND